MDDATKVLEEGLHPFSVTESTLDGNHYTSSLKLAEVTGKLHRNVLRDIEAEMRSLRSILEECSEHPEISSAAEKSLRGVKLTTYEDAGGKSRKAYLLDKFATYQLLLRYSLSARLLIAQSSLGLSKSFEGSLDSLSVFKALRYPKYIYIAQDSDKGVIKVGVSSNPGERLKQLQTGNSSDLTLVYVSDSCQQAFEVESKIHEKFANSHIRGEWFKIKPNKVIKEIEKLVGEP